MSELINQLMKEIHDCYKIAKKYRTSTCTQRSQLLYFALKNNGFEPKVWRYLTSEDQEKRVEITLISGEIYWSHVVLLLNEDILDSNLPEKISKEEYDKKINEKNKGTKIISVDYQINPDITDLKKICKECGLSSFFTEALNHLD